jgi:hypothetical protein
MYTGLPPFQGYHNDLQVVMAVCGGARPDRPNKCRMHEELWTLAARCWDNDQNLRPNMVEISHEVSVICSYHFIRSF